ncbi:hypothetical protein M8C21_000751 [Ambrosia artemisiifolia]|uniref:Uncharacterized protein n=1 Tax=Ambrosia artemisiifolia TaxID=4212 RepID=A0AAD5CKJ8_AMBAR|nr:hypothetical protein M8C21_000751 [Ambrosia artemisiifolia]
MHNTNKADKSGEYRPNDRPSSSTPPPNTISQGSKLLKQECVSHSCFKLARICSMELVSVATTALSSAVTRVSPADAAGASVAVVSALGFVRLNI